MNRLRALAERPVEDRVARALVVLALAVTVGPACVIGLSGQDDANRPATPTGRGPRDATPLFTRSTRPAHRIAPPPTRHRRQDAQDRSGTTAHRRAAHELATHRALQHVPWREGRVRIRLLDARGGRAVLLVLAPDIRAGHRGYRDFLRTYHDAGSAYLPRFVGDGGAR